jgi:LysM repeat protein
MAAKPTKPKKFRQARKDAKTAAKKTFSGKPQARLKDPLAKLDLIDKEALKEVSKESKGNFITDERGNKIQTKPVETAKERIAREKKAAMDKFRSRVAAEDGIAEKPAAEKKITKKAAAEKPAVKKPATASSTASKQLKTPEGKARYDKLIKEGVKPKSAMNKALFYEAKLPSQKGAATPKAESKPKVKKAGATKNGAFKKVTDASLTSQEDAYRQSKVDKLVKEGKLSGSKEIAIRSKGEVVKPGSKVPATRTQVATRIPGSDTVVKKKGKLGKFAKGGAYLAALTAVLDSPNYTDAAKRKAQAEVDLYAAKNGGKNPGVVDRLKITAKGMPMVQKQVLKYFTGGIVGEDASVSAAKAEKELATYKAKQEEKNRKFANKNLRYGPGGESLVPGTDAWKKGSKTRPKPVAPGAAGSTTPGTKPGAGSAGGGSSSGGSKGGSGTTPSVTAGSTYTVKSGDTLSAIAKASGVKLSDIYAANKKFKQNPKYKGGNMIWSGTTVKIPTIKK